MLQRELTKVSICSVIGLLLGIIIWVTGLSSIVSLLFFPLYMIGLFYGASWLLNLLAQYIKTIFQASVFVHNLFGFVMILLAILIGFPVILLIGWLAGLGRTLISIHEAWETDRRYHLNKRNFQSDDDEKFKW